MTTPDGTTLTRITFAEITGDSLHWSLAVSQDNGRTWTDRWTMEMRRT